MELKPIVKYDIVKYPTRTVLDDHPELLYLVPKRWQANPVVLTALTAASMLFSSHAFADDKDASSVSRVAQIFKHGEGQASFGGDVSSMAVLLSEDDARQIITDEAKKHGIYFLPIAEILTDVSVPAIPPLINIQNGKQDNKAESSSPNMTLYMDGTDWKQKISFEYISETDYDKWRDMIGECSSTLKYYDFLRAAVSLQDALAMKKPSGAHAVFYDPAARRVDPKIIKEPLGGAEHEATETPWMKANTEALEKARMELREQVKDFVKWLKAQGVI